MKIALCMVIKDEGRTIRKTIESALPVVDEVVILIDDKTSDNSAAEIRKSLVDFEGMKDVRNFTWENDFSKARNESLSIAKSDYALILDGHEYIGKESIDYFKELKRTTSREIDIFYFPIGDKNDGFGGLENTQPRLFKSHLRYKREMHNALEWKEGLKSQFAPQIKIWHDQPLDRKKFRKGQRRKMSVEKMIANFNNGDPQSGFYVAQTYLENEKYEKAIEWYRKYIPKSNWDTERYQARLGLAMAQMKSGAKDHAKETLLECFTEPMQANTHLIGLGDIYFNEEKYNEAVNFYRMATAFKKPIAPMIKFQTHDYTWLPWFKLAKCYLMLNNVEGVRECIRQGKVFGSDVNDFYVIENSLNGVLNNRRRNKNGKVYIACSIPSFIKDISAELTVDYNVLIEQKFDPHNAANCDLIFCEWADHNAISVSNFDTDVPKVLRVHNYEVYNDHFVNQINWQAFDKIIFVADHVVDYLLQRLGEKTVEAIHIAKKSVMIHNWVDFEKFTIAQNKQQNNKIAYAGNFNETKGIRMILQLAKEFPKYEFHLAGKWQQDDLRRLVHNTRTSNVFIHSYREDLNQFFADKSYYISTSLREGCPVALAEAMAAGLKPLIQNWIGARDIFPDHFVWGRFNEVADLLESGFEPEEYRKFAKEKFNKENLQKIIDITINLLKKKHERSSDILQSVS